MSENNIFDTVKKIMAVAKTRKVSKTLPGLKKNYPVETQAAVWSPDPRLEMAS
jgi:hypothetical protein